MKHPKDLKIKIGSKDEAFWTSMKRKCQEVIDGSRHEVEIQDVILELCDKRIKEEQDDKNND